MGSGKSKIEYVDNPETLKRLEELRKANEDMKRQFETAMKEGNERNVKELKKLYDDNESLRKTLDNEIKRGNKEIQKLRETIDKPIKDRSRKIKEVNDLKLDLKKTNHVAFIGLKGSGKSTFRWLIDKTTKKPTMTMDDGTTEMETSFGIIDTIGLKGWSIINLLKMLSIFIIIGLPKDLLIFPTNTRVEQIAIPLARIGIINPMYTVINNNVWEHLNTKSEIRDSDIYVLKDMKRIEKRKYGTIVTHRDFMRISSERSDYNVFETLKRSLGDVSKFDSSKIENDNIRESLARLIWLFVHKYKRDQLKFINDCELEEFNVMDDEL